MSQMTDQPMDQPMGVSNTIEVACPACGATMRVPHYESLNGRDDADALRALREGTLFDATCPSCGAVTELNYPVLLHDVQNHSMVQYVDDEADLASANNVFDQLLASAEDAGMSKILMHGYRLRVVTSHNALREKALLLEAGIDDRMVEVVKAVALYQLAGADAARSAEAYFDGVEDDGSVDLVAFLDGEARPVVAPPELVDQVGEGMDANPNADGYAIDRAWAVAALGL